MASSAPSSLSATSATEPKSESASSLTGAVVTPIVARELRGEANRTSAPGLDFRSQPFGGAREKPLGDECNSFSSAASARRAARRSREAEEAAAESGGRSSAAASSERLRGGSSEDGGGGDDSDEEEDAANFS